jgi:hypothetical protein
VCDYTLDDWGLVMRIGLNWLAAVSTRQPLPVIMLVLVMAVIFIVHNMNVF